MRVSYFDCLREAIRNQDHYPWDYYHCHGEDIGAIFYHPVEFIERTFLYAGKDSLTSPTAYAEGDDYPTRFTDARAAHSISSFFMGFLLGEGLMGGDTAAFCSNDGVEGYPFSYVWSLTSLYHDYGYRFETDGILCETVRRDAEVHGAFQDYRVIKALRRGLRMNHSIWGPKYNRRPMESLPYKSRTPFLPEKRRIESYIHDRISGFRCNGVCVDTPVRTCRTINDYLTYRISGEMGSPCLDHGITGGMFFYDRILKNMIQLFREELEWNANTGIEAFTIENGMGRTLRVGLDQTILFLYIADCIINHNIWKAGDDSESLYLYQKYGLDSLIGENFKKVNFHENPLLFILCMSDTLEPYKNFFRTVHGCGIDVAEYDRQAVFDIFRDYRIAFENDTIQITVPDSWVERMEQMLKDMTFWIDISFTASGNCFEISVK